MSLEPEASTDNVAAASRRRMLTGVGAVAGAGLIAVAGAAPAQAAPTEGGEFFSVTPERLLDTRSTGGPISVGQTRLVPLTGLDGFTIFVNITVVNTAGNGYLALYDADEASRPSPYSNVNWQGAGKIVANLGLVSLGAEGFNVYCGGGQGTRTNFILDIVGFAAAPTPAAAAQKDAFRRRVRRAQVG